MMICKVVAEDEIEGAKKILDGFCEWRLDYLKKIDLDQIEKISSGKRIILSLRPKWCGGLFRDEGKRIGLLKKIIGFHPYLVDLEMETEGIEILVKEARRKKAKFILSHHDFKKTPNMGSLHKILENARKHRPHITKIVTKANTLEDNLTALRFCLYAKSRIVCFCMGNLGAMSRIFCPHFGSVFTYAGNVAPGQLPFETMEKIYDLLGDRYD